MKFYKFIILSLLFSASCTNDMKDDPVINEQNEYAATHKEVFSNEKFKCYESSLATKTENGFPEMLIKVEELPNIDIYFGDNNDPEYKEFPNKSIFYEDNKPLFTLYSEVIESENGFVINLCKSTGEVSSVFLPKATTKSVGSGTMSCLSDAYTNHGWASVLITVQSAFLPQTVVAMAAACAINNF